jgi:hypothetical protein
MILLFEAIGSFILCSFGLYAIVLLYGFLLDRKDKGKFEKLPRMQQRDGFKPEHRQALQKKIHEGLADQRLLPITKKVPDLDKDGNQKKDPKGKPLFNTEFKLEKFDDYGIPIDPGSSALTLRKLYLLLFLVSSLVTFIGMVTWIPLTAIGIIIAIVNIFMIMKNGKECMEVHDNIIKTLKEIAQGKLNAPADASPEDIFTIQDWEYEGEAQTIADAITKAGEDGKTAEVQKHIPKEGQKKPRMARFRTVPSKIVFNFPTSFMESGESAFLNHMNQNIGGGTVDWVAEKTEIQNDGSIVKKDGWDFTNKQVSVKTMPPLPKVAMLPKDIGEGPWNAIRLGRTVSGEAIWDLSGQGDSMGKDAAGNPIPKKIELKGAGLGVTTPMGLVPLDTQTQVWVIEETDNDNS